MSSLSKELVFLMLQFLDEEKYKETVHKLEKESGFYFNMRYFEETVTNGEWDEVESYLFGFTKVDDNRYSMKIFFEIRKQKYLEALDKHDNDKAVDILRKDLKVFSTFNEDLFKEITLLLSLENFRENAQLSKYGNTTTARAIMLGELKKLIEANPLFRDKLQFPSLKNSRLRTLINQSLNWQHQLCKNPKNNPDIKTLFVDHNCAQINGVLAPSPVTNPMMGGIPKVGGYPPLGAHGPFQPTPASLTASLAGWISNPSSVPHQTISLGPMNLAAPTVSASMLKHPRTPATNNPAIDYMADSEHVLKRARPLGLPEEVNNMPVAYPGQIPVHTSFSSVDLPKTVIVNLSLGSAVNSMDFNPAQQTLLLVGTHKGDTTLWEVGCRERLALRNFKTWNPGSLSLPLQASLANECSVGVTRVMWSPDGALFGVAYTKNIVHVYSYRGGDDIRNHLEIDAHVGTVNDLAFAYPNKQLCIITCGDDKTIKVWDIENGSKRYTFEGHEAPVYSVCPHHKENIQFIFSTSLDGKIKAWLYDTAGSRVDYDAPGHFCTTMAYSADGTRLFSCGTSKDGESHIVEWNESEGAVKRAYHGLGKASEAVVQFDTLKNRFLAAGDEFQVKIWDMDNVNLLTATDAEGGLMSTPKIRFNKEGMLLAVSTKDNGIKILANTDGCRLLRSIENRALDASRVAAGSLVKGPGIGTFAASTSTPVTSVGIPDRTAPLMAMVALNGDNQSLPDVKPRITEESEKCKIWKPTEISEPSQLRSLRLADKVFVARGTCCANKSPGCCTIHSHPDRVHLHFKNMQVGPIMLCLSQQIVRLKYTNSGSAILALTYNAVHQLWKWPKGNQNPTGKATTGLSPELWQPASGMLMTNEINATNTEDPVSCFALSKNDSYVMSASGGKISLFNMMTFKTMAKFMPPPPAATYLAFHPQDNNIVAIGMDDSSIQIYNVRVDEVKSKLKGHQKKVTGLAFSNALNVLVSSGADAQLCVWSTDAWEKQASKFLQLPAGRVPAAVAHTHVQFHQDQIHLLAVHETQLGIYEARKLECVNQWSPPQDSSGAITDATYSCDSQTIFASFEDGSVGVFAATSLRMRCLINAKAYLTSNPSQRLYPVVITTHPIEPSQFALGLSDGGVHVIEPLENEAGWGHCGPT